MITRRMAVIPGVVLSCLSAFASATGAQTRPTMDAGEPQKMLLWEHGAPGALGSDESDKPTLTYYPPTHGNPSGTAVIIAPGGRIHALGGESRRAASGELAEFDGSGGVCADLPI